MTGKQVLFLLLAIAGAVLTWYHNYQYMLVSDGVFSVADFIAGGMANPAAASLTMDIGIAATTGFIWMFFESRRLGMKYIWAYLISGCFIAFAFAFPLFLMMRERKLAELESQDQPGAIAAAAA